MHTIVWNVDNQATYTQFYPQLEQASNLLMQGEVVAFPTETVYGLGAIASSDEAVQKIYKAKGRPSDNPLIVHIANKEMLQGIVADDAVTPEVAKLMNTFWPGPLTIVLKKGPNVCETVTAGLQTVAVRMPDHPIALALIEQTKTGLAAPSANTSGKPSPTSKKHVFADLFGKIAGIVDGGSAGVGVESTVLDCSSVPFTILRPGGVTKEALEKVVGTVRSNAEEVAVADIPRAPGMKYTHYAPKAPLYLVHNPKQRLLEVAEKLEREGETVGILSTEVTNHYAHFYLGDETDLETVAQRLYEGLRYFDDSNVTVILAPVFDTLHLGAAIMNRLDKASTAYL
ncbi:MAG: L-threonylcarbamoyladenylate synthase [Bacilli bacterium]